MTFGIDSVPLIQGFRRFNWPRGVGPSETRQMYRGLCTPLFRKASVYTIMSISNEIAKEIFDVHHALWDSLIKIDEPAHSLEYQNQTYKINISPDRGYASCHLPNENGKMFLWITQNLNKSTSGSYQIKQAMERGEQRRTTWVVDTSTGNFKYRSNITTSKDKHNNLVFAQIEIYDSLGTEILWTTTPYGPTKKAKF